MESKIPFIYQGLAIQNPKLAESCKQHEETLRQGLAEGKIFNVDFNEAKQTFSHACRLRLVGLDNLMPRSGVKEDRSDDAGFQLYVKYDWSSYTDMISCKKMLRNIESAISTKVDGIADSHTMQVLEAIKKVLEGMVELKELYAALKDKIVKGRKPAAPNPNAFMPVLGSKESQELVEKTIMNVISPKLDAYEAGLLKYFQSIVKQIASQKEISPKEFSMNPIFGMIFTHCFDYGSVRTKDGIVYKDIKKINGSSKWIESEAKKIREGIQKNFIAKNIRKLSAIVDQKGNLNYIEQLPSKEVLVQGSAGTVEAGFHFVFKDGAHFSVVNKIVSKYSNRNTWFQSFPTTFHDVVFSNGESMKYPSEEKMVKEFK